MYAKCHYAEFHYAECHYADRRGAVVSCFRFPALNVDLISMKMESEPVGPRPQNWLRSLSTPDRDKLECLSLPKISRSFLMSPSSSGSFFAGLHYVGYRSKLVQFEAQKNIFNVLKKP
jgi:hypothetical protein